MDTNKGGTMKPIAAISKYVIASMLVGVYEIPLIRHNNKQLLLSIQQSC
ncbi:hypothetical protein MY04_06115 [Flammeovirga sp. MY04]|nr:hypothetical protein [Flammeovirga sp. MY04]QJD09403.1 hypothetical protein MY04_06115 [Flammeovirga sp. MY04]